MSVGEAGVPEWEEDDRDMKARAEERWRHVVAHESGHATASLANGNAPDTISILIGQLVDEDSGLKMLGLTKNSGLPNEATAEAKATVLLAGSVAEEMLFGKHGKGAERDLVQLEPLIKEIAGREGEKRTEAKIREDLLADTKALLEIHKAVFDELYESGVERAEEFGFLKLNETGTAIELITGAMLVAVWEQLKPKE
jgi:hypothetical protein